MRWFRLGIGSALLYQGIHASDNISIFFGVFLLVQAVTNTGCCNTSCSTSQFSQSKKEDDGEPSFEVINRN